MKWSVKTMVATGCLAAVLGWTHEMAYAAESADDALVKLNIQTGQEDSSPQIEVGVLEQSTSSSDSESHTSDSLLNVQLDDSIAGDDIHARVLPSSHSDAANADSHEAVVELNGTDTLIGDDLHVGVLDNHEQTMTNTDNEHKAVVEVSGTDTVLGDDLHVGVLDNSDQSGEAASSNYEAAVEVSGTDTMLGDDLHVGVLDNTEQSGEGTSNDHEAVVEVSGTDIILADNMHVGVLDSTEQSGEAASSNEQAAAVVDLGNVLGSDIGLSVLGNETIRNSEGQTDHSAVVSVSIADGIVPGLELSLLETQNTVPAENNNGSEPAQPGNNGTDIGSNPDNDNTDNDNNAGNNSSNGNGSTDGSGTTTGNSSTGTSGSGNAGSPSNTNNPATPAGTGSSNVGTTSTTTNTRPNDLISSGNESVNTSTGVPANDTNTSISAASTGEIQPIADTTANGDTDISASYDPSRSGTRSIVPAVVHPAGTSSDDLSDTTVAAANTSAQSGDTALVIDSMQNSNTAGLTELPQTGDWSHPWHRYVPGLLLIMAGIALRYRHLFAQHQ